jgi:hypothetical protein
MGRELTLLVRKDDETVLEQHEDIANFLDLVADRNRFPKENSSGCP